MSTFTIIEEEKKASTGNNTDDIAVLPFEGPEKTLEIDFVPTIGHKDGLRALPLAVWEDIVSTSSNTKIVIIKSNFRCAASRDWGCKIQRRW